MVAANKDGLQLLDRFGGGGVSTESEMQLCTHARTQGDLFSCTREWSVFKCPVSYWLKQKEMPLLSGTSSTVAPSCLTIL